MSDTKMDNKYGFAAADDVHEWLQARKAAGTNGVFILCPSNTYP